MFIEISNHIEKLKNSDKIQELSKLSKQIIADHKSIKKVKLLVNTKSIVSSEKTLNFDSNEK